MATYDMTSSDTAGVGANVLAVPTVVGNSVRTIEAILDIDAMVTAGYSGANGDIFQLLEIPAESVIVAAGAEIMKPFTSSERRLRWIRVAEWVDLQQHSRL